MHTTNENGMGRFSVDVSLANRDDMMRAENGLVAADEVRRVTIRGVVDSGAARLVIPASTAAALGLDTSAKAKVRYADGRTAERAIAKRISLSYGGREGIFDAIVEPDRNSALIGAMVMEVLDFYIDCTGQRLLPRDSKQILAEIE